MWEDGGSGGGDCRGHLGLIAVLAGLIFKRIKIDLFNY